MEAKAPEHKTPSAPPNPNDTCDFSDRIYTPAYSDGRPRWIGCGQRIGDHVQVPYGDRYVAYVPPQVPYPCFVYDGDPGRDKRPETREQAREKAGVEMARRRAKLESRGVALL
jgi:hypothetical protein